MYMYMYMYVTKKLNIKILRSEAFRLTHTYSHLHTHTHTHTHTSLSHIHSVVADLKSVVYAVGITYGTEDDWDFVWNKYLMTSDPYEKRLYLSALGHSRVPWILSR